MRSRMLVDADYYPTTDDRELAFQSYIPTPEIPQADEEWIAEEVAMERISKHVEGVKYVQVIDTEFPRIIISVREIE